MTLLLCIYGMDLRREWTAEVALMMSGGVVGRSSRCDLSSVPSVGADVVVGVMTSSSMVH